VVSLLFGWFWVVSLLFGSFWVVSLNIWFVLGDFAVIWLILSSFAIIIWIGWFRHNFARFWVVLARLVMHANNCHILTNENELNMVPDPPKSLLVFAFRAQRTDLQSSA